VATFAIRYTYGENSTVGRDEHREEHMEFLTAQFAAKRLLVSGRLRASDTPGALLIVSGDSADDVAALMDGDPFMQNGLVASREIAEWNLVFGEIAR
jgi:Uncharacterized protein conserved in bacteria